VIRTLKRKRIALLSSAEDLYSKELAASFRGEASRLGVQLVAERTIARGTTDFTKDLQALKQAKPDVIYTPLYYNAMVPIAHQAHALSIPGAAFIGADGWDAESFLQDAGDDLEGALMTNHWAPDAPWPMAQRFIALYKERFGREPSSLAALGHDAALILLDAIARTSSPTPTALRDAIAATHIEGATGPISFDASRNPNKPVIVNRIRAKKFTYHASASFGPEDPR
jgi:branched-chain amino acid transport system substrate-binding protein